MDAENRRFCVWNGWIASAPGHPFLAKAIETVVNQVRNRFTSVDVDARFCETGPIAGKQEMSILHSFDMLFTAGPCDGRNELTCRLDGCVVIAAQQRHQR